ncbi:MAG: hypothetical protein JNL52_11775 [Flavobacteriales bacterium]|nr:hypothetical protein [Flavobacteriales bacterium]
MTAIEASLSGTFRTILVLVIVWWLLRFFLRMQAARQSGNSSRNTYAGQDRRAPGEVRIEQAPNNARPTQAKHSGPDIIDVDFEEVK